MKTTSKWDRYSALVADTDLLYLMWVFGQHQIQNLIIVVINKKQSFPFFMFPDETLRDLR